jgi:hypothetical protein
MPIINLNIHKYGNSPNQKMYNVFVIPSSFKLILGLFSFINNASNIFRS